MSLRVRKIIKGVTRRVRRPLQRYLRRHGLILMYHRIAQVRNDPWNLCVSPAHFRQHLEMLTRVADIVPLPELSQRLTTGRARRPAVSITFDDGYLDNHTEALPLLQSFGAPATMFIATGWIGRGEPFWWDLLSELVMTSPLPAKIAVSVGDAPVHWQREGSVPSADERQALHRSLWTRLQVASEPDRSAALEELCDLVRFDSTRVAGARAMNADELLRTGESGVVELGAHTISHSPLPKCSEAGQRAEILGSRQQCEALLGVAPTSFAYPYGELDATSRRLVEEAGFARACTSNEDLVWDGQDPWLLPRIAAPNLDGKAFERRLKSAWLM